MMPRPTEQDRSSNGPEFFISNLFPVYTRDGAILFPARSRTRTAPLGKSDLSGQPRSNLKTPKMWPRWNGALVDVAPTELIFILGLAGFVSPFHLAKSTAKR